MNSTAQMFRFIFNLGKAACIFSGIHLRSEMKAACSRAFCILMTVENPFSECLRFVQCAAG